MIPTDYGAHMCETDVWKIYAYIDDIITQYVTIDDGILPHTKFYTNVSSFAPNVTWHVLKPQWRDIWIG